MNQEGMRQKTIEKIAGLLKAEKKGLSQADALFAAEQFITIVIGAPQRRAMMNTKDALSPKDMKDWAKRSVKLFLEGLA
jgi:hypothetical protein